MKARKISKDIVSLTALFSAILFFLLILSGLFSILTREVITVQSLFETLVAGTVTGVFTYFVWKATKQSADIQASMFEEQIRAVEEQKHKQTLIRIQMLNGFNKTLGSIERGVPTLYKQLVTISHLEKSIGQVDKLNKDYFLFHYGSLVDDVIKWVDEYDYYFNNLYIIELIREDYDKIRSIDDSIRVIHTRLVKPYFDFQEGKIDFSSLLITIGRTQVSINHQIPIDQPVPIEQPWSSIIRELQEKWNATKDMLKP
ncbi:hypothetical protein [Halobacillus trueperi]|uniref:Uncharacterized protein n=1 Tax=Halobacillus trueperi TaxID=156205 RepID=A0A3E0J7V2_9BACI|nr:hypothetical protein [Halobacillus trueperi]REJ09038.1 hypothetical protein DYE48_11710 [Halobacillus trueperi]